MKIFTHTLKDLDVNLTYDKGSIAYTFEVADKNYGYKIKLPSRSIEDVMNTTFALVTNALETKEAVDKLNEQPAI